MCFSIDITPVAKVTWDDAVEIAEQTSVGGRILVTPRERGRIAPLLGFERKCRAWSITEDGGCACSLLGYEFVRDPLVPWPLMPDALGPLEMCLRRIADRLEASFIYLSTFGGDPPSGEERVTLEEMIALVRRNAVADKRYWVSTDSVAAS